MPATKVGAGSFVKVAQRLEAKMMLPFYLILVTDFSHLQRLDRADLLRSSQM